MKSFKHRLIKEKIKKNNPNSGFEGFRGPELIPSTSELHRPWQ